jgi:hypothetical protein
LIGNLWFGILEPPRLRSRFPFVVLSPHAPFALPKGFLGPEPVAGLLWVAPLVLLLVLAPWLRRKWQARAECLVCLGTLAFLGAAWVGIDALVASTMRYEADYAAVFFVVSAVVACALAECCAPNGRPWFYGAVVSLGLFGVVINGAIGMTGQYDNFRSASPEAYERIADRFSPVEKLLAISGVPPDRDRAPGIK